MRKGLMCQAQASSSVWWHVEDGGCDKDGEDAELLKTALKAI